MVPPLDQSSQAIVTAIRMRGWKIDVARQGNVYCVVAWQAGGASRAAAGNELCSALRALAEKLGLQADDYW